MAPPTFLKLIGPGSDSGSTHSSGLHLAKITISLIAQQQIEMMPTTVFNVKEPNDD